MAVQVCRPIEPESAARAAFVIAEPQQLRLQLGNEAKHVQRRDGKALPAIDGAADNKARRG